MMNRLTLCSFLSICAVCGRADAATVADIDKAVAAVASYDTSQPRRPLLAIEEIVRQTRGQTELRRHLERKLVELLKSGASGECKLFVCQQLWVVGSDAGLPTLEQMLLDEKTAHMACYALGLSPSPKAGAALRAALGRGTGKARLQIIIQLGQRRDVASVAALSKLLGGSDAAAAQAAAVALGQIGGETAAKALASARATAKLRAVATQAYLQCAERLAAEGETKKAIAIYDELHDEREPRLIRRGALLGLMRVGGERVVPLVISVLRGEDRMMKAAAVAGIRTLEGEGVGRRFAAELPKLPPAVQVLLVGALAGRGDASARSAITAAAASPSAEVRTAALEALGTIGDAASASVLAKAVAAGKSEGERQAALVALRALRGDRVDAAIVESLKAARPEARPALIQALHDRNAVSAVPALLEQAKEEAVRRAAFRALGRLAGPKDVPALVGLLVALDGDTGRKDGEKAVVLVSRKIADEAARADAALAALRTAKGEAARCSLLRVLRGIASANALEAVKAALGDADAGVTDTAVRALADWPDPRATGALLAIVKSTKSDVHRVVALRGYVRLLAEAGGIPTQQTLKAYGALMQQARGPQDRKLILGALARVGHPAALKLVEPLLADAAVKAEAELAALSIARTIAGADPEAARAAMAKLLATSKNADLRTQAQKIIGQTGKLGGYVAAWQVAGPYVEEGKQHLQLFGVAFPPEKAEARDVSWRLLPLPAAGRPWMLDLLGPLGGGEQRVAYVRTWIHSETPKPARLEFGTDDGNKVWLNGKLVHAKNVGGAAVPGGYKANVVLRQGWNALLLKITQCSGPWQFCLTICKRDGGRLEGIRVDCFGPPSQ